MRELKNGFHVPQLPFELTHVRDIVEYEGPLVSEFQNDKGEPYIYHFCEASDERSRWLVVRAQRTELVRYEAGNVSLRQLLKGCPEQLAWMLDIDSDGITRGVYAMPIAHVPEQYFPPSDQLVVVGDAGSRQSLLLDGANGYDLVSYLPRQYLQPYGFAALFGPHGDATALGVLGKLDHNCGWVFHNVFENRLRFGNYKARATVRSMEFSSPGYLTFNVNAVVADDLRYIVRLYIHGGGELRKAARRLQKWSNSKRRDSIEGKALLFDVCEQLELNFGELRKHTQELADTAKLLSAFVTRLHKLAVNHVLDTATIVGLELDEGKRRAFIRRLRGKKKKAVVVTDEVEAEAEAESFLDGE
jgi:hypothetical protein